MMAGSSPRGRSVGDCCESRSSSGWLSSVERMGHAFGLGLECKGGAGTSGGAG